MKRKWYGRDLIKTEWKRWRALFIFWCLFDLMFSPVLFAVCSLMRRKSRDKTVRGRRSRILSCCGKMDSDTKQIIQSSIFHNKTVTLHNLNQSSLRIWKPFEIDSTPAPVNVMEGKISVVQMYTVLKDLCHVCAS